LLDRDVGFIGADGIDGIEVVLMEVKGLVAAALAQDFAEGALACVEAEVLFDSGAAGRCDALVEVGDEMADGIGVPTD
jgi:hypothetical protein